MASVSVSHMIIFIASIMVAASVVGVFTDSITQVSEAIDDRGVSVSQSVRTDIAVISDAGSTEVYDESDGNITIHIKNTGTQTLRAESAAIDLFVDGQYASDMTVTVLGDTETWGQGDVVKVEINPPDSWSAGGDHRIKVIVNEDEEVFRFRI